MRAVVVISALILASCSKEEPTRQPAAVQQPVEQPSQKKQQTNPQQALPEQANEIKEVVLYTATLQDSNSSTQSADETQDYSLGISVEIVEIGEKPHIKLKASSDLPDDSWIQCWLYSGSVDPGRHIENSSATIKDGKGEFLFRCFAEPGKIPKARYVFDLHFNYEMQMSMEVQKKIKEMGKALSFRKAITWDFGTIDEQKNYEISVRKRVHDFLGSIPPALEKVAASGNNPEALKKLAAEERERIMGEMNRLYTSVDLKVYSLDGFVSTVGEEISNLTDQCLMAAENGDLVSAQRILILLRNRVALVQSRILEHSASADRIKELLRECEQLINSVTDAYVQEWSGKAVRPKYKDMLLSYPDEMDKLCIELSFDCPKEVQPDILALREAIVQYFEAASAAAKVKELNRDPLDEKAKSISLVIKEILRKLK